jgi:hypothetical protein
VCHRENSQGVFPSSSSSGTPSGTASGTPSDTTSLASNTKNMGELAVVISAACAGRIGDMGFVHPRGLQLLSS